MRFSNGVSLLDQQQLAKTLNGIAKGLSRLSTKIDVPAPRKHSHFIQH
jgi:hypothetical protein